MTTKKQRVVVVCPGRGTYNKEELGYFHRYHQDKLHLLEVIDKHRSSKGQPTVKELDLMPNYSMKIHTAGENASSLIYACALGDFHAIDRDKYDIVAITGNSMGWYIALATAGALSPAHSIELINTMGSMMKDGVIGGQLIYPIVDENWIKDEAREQLVWQKVAQVNELAGAQVYLSINLGGYLVFGGNKLGLTALTQALPMIDDRYPMNLFNHAAFHTPLLAQTSELAMRQLPKVMFHAPEVPLIDGEGRIWQPYATNNEKLWYYTLATQVTCPYNYSKAIEVAVKEFAPDKLIILGPGATLGGATAQALIEQRWLDMQNKADFIARQKHDPSILAMGMPEQREKVVAN
jgi:malonyl CoA-acyl carrier protein transacylase